MASQPEVIGNLALSVTRDQEFMVGVGIEPTATPREGDPLLGIHGCKTPLHHPPLICPFQHCLSLCAESNYQLFPWSHAN